MSLLAEKPYIFIGSSSEAKEVAHAIQRLLAPTCEVEVWSQDFFELGEGFLESLIKKSKQFDFAILVATCDDEISYRGASLWAPRDNVILELGLFLGVLGAKRTFLIYEDSSPKRLKLPTDLDVTLASFQRGKKQTLASALGPAVSKILAIVENRGCRPESHDFNADLRVDIYYRKKGFDRVKALSIHDRMSSINLDCRTIAHSSVIQPDAIFIGSHVSAGEIRAIMPSVTHPIRFIFHTMYPESEGGDQTGRKFGIGYDSQYVGMRGISPRDFAKPVTKRNLNWLTHEDRSSTEIQAFLTR